MESSGWIKLHRQALNHEIRRFDPTAWRLFETLLLLVDRRTGEWSGGRKQLVYADGSIKEATVFKAQKRLEKAGMIEVTSNSKYSTYRICNFDKFNELSNSKVTTKSQQSNTLTRSKNKEVYNVDLNLLNLLNEKTGRNFRTLPKGYKQTLATFSLPEIEKALGVLVKDSWHVEKLSELSSSYLLRVSTIDNMLSKSDTTKDDDKYGNDWFDKQRG